MLGTCRLPSPVRRKAVISDSDLSRRACRVAFKKHRDNFYPNVYRYARYRNNRNYPSIRSRWISKTPETFTKLCNLPRKESAGGFVFWWSEIGVTSPSSLSCFAFQMAPTPFSLVSHPPPLSSAIDRRTMPRWIRTRLTFNSWRTLQRDSWLSVAQEYMIAR